MSRPRLGHRAIDAYNRLSRECAAYNYVLRYTKQSGPVSWSTLLAVNGMINIANRLFRRHADLPRFLPIDVNEPMTQADFAVIITRLASACIHFEEQYSNAPRTNIDRHLVALQRRSAKP